MKEYSLNNKKISLGINHILTSGLLVLFLLVTSACLGIASPLPVKALEPSTLTPTPTPVIFAQEQSATPPGKGGAIWNGTVTSSTSRQYMSNGKLVNSCKTDWVTDLTMVVDSSGHMTGDAEGRLITPRTCTAATNLVPNLTGFTLKVDGTKKDLGFEIQLTYVSKTPGSPAGEFGGYTLLFVHAPCDSKPRNLPIPLTSSTTAEANISYSEVMTGCGGSKDDIMASTNLFKFAYSFDCKNRPSDLNDPEIIKLCQ